MNGTVGVRRLVAAFAVVILAALGAPPDARADHVVLSNGDALTGGLAATSKTELALDTELAGRVTVKWSAVSQVTSAAPIRATLANGQTVEGTLAMSGGRLSIRRTDGTRVAIDLATLRGLDLADKPAALPSWHGALNAGWDVSRGNSETSTISTNGTATRVGAHDRLGVFGTYLFSAFGSGTNSVTTARATSGGIRYDHDVLGRLFGFAFGDAENDPLQLLDLRTVVGAGAGAHVSKTDATQFNVFGGVSYARDSYAAGTTTTATAATPTASGPSVTPPGLGGTPPGRSGVRPTRGGTPPSVVRASLSRNVGEFLAGQDLTHQLSDTVNVAERLTLFPAIGDAQDYRISFDLSLSAQLSGWLQWNVTAADRYLHIPPAGGAVQNDTFVSTGLGITFGHGESGAYTGADSRRPPPARK
jgi:putative salt-induced outer membrane protein